MSYRLGKRDERDVRWGLSQDVKGDMGMCSSFDGFERAMNLRAKIQRYTPPEPRRDCEGGLVLRNFTEQYIPVKDARPTFTTYELDERFLDAARDIRVVWGAFEDIGPVNLSVLDRCYGERCPGGFEVFGELAPLAVETRTASERWHPYEVKRREGRDPGLFYAVMALAARMKAPESIADKEQQKFETEMFSIIRQEADDALSAASQAYVHAAARRRQNSNIADAARAARRRAA